MMSLRHVGKVVAWGATGALTSLMVAAWQPATTRAQEDTGAAADKGVGAAAEGAGGAQQGAPAGDTMHRLQGAAGVGVSTGVGEAAKGTGLGGAAQKGGAAAVQDYMKGSQGSTAPAAPAGGEPAAGEGAAPNAPAGGDSDE